MKADLGRGAWSAAKSDPYGRTQPGNPPAAQSNEQGPPSIAQPNSQRLSGRASTPGRELESRAVRATVSTGLTTREREILGLIAKGRTSKEIASDLHLSPGTVAAHRRNICYKNGLHSTVQLAVFAARTFR